MREKIFFIEWGACIKREGERGKRGQVDDGNGMDRCDVWVVRRLVER